MLAISFIIVAYLVIAWLTGVSALKLDEWIARKNSDFPKLSTNQSTLVGLAWPVTIPVAILGILYGLTVKSYERIMK